MKPSFFLLLFLLGAPFICCCQPFNWEWAKRATGPGDQEGFACATDKYGNVYATGFFQGDSITFDTTTFYNNPHIFTFQNNMFLVKYSPAGNLIWARKASITDTGRVVPYSLATDATGNIFMCGLYSGNSVSLGSAHLSYTPPQSAGFFIAKYDSAGNVLWARNAGGKSYDGGTSVAADRSGNTYATGWFNSDTIRFGSTVLVNPGGESGYGAIFIVKYDAAGNAVWAITPAIVYPQNDHGIGITADGAGGVYTTGWYANNQITFGNTTLELTGSENVYLAKYDSAGNNVWAKNIISLDGEVDGITCDNSGVYITGTFLATTISFNTITLQNNTINQNNQFYLAKYDTQGNALWAQGSSGGTGSIGFGLSTNGNGHIYVVGGFTGTSIVFNNLTLLSPTNSPDPLFTLMYDSMGNVLCGAVLASGADDMSGICVDSMGNAYISSDFENVSPFIVGPDTLILPQTDPGAENFYIAKYICSSCIATNLTYSLSPTSICLGDSALITFTGGYGFSISPADNVSWLDSVHALLSPDTTTQYTVNGYPACGTLVSQTFTLPVFFSRGIVITTSEAGLCPDDSVFLCVPAGFSYTWSTGATTACISTTTSGRYNVTVSDNGQCSATCNKYINAYTVSPFNLNQHNDTLSYNSGTNYNWMLNGTAIAGATSSFYVFSTGGTYTLQITDSNGCTITSNPVIVSGIDDISNSNISVYPNPSSGSWMLTVDNSLLGSEADVFDAEGRLIFKTEIRALQTEISFSAARGVYTLRLNAPGMTLVRKLVKL